MIEAEIIKALDKAGIREIRRDMARHIRDQNLAEATDMNLAVWLSVFGLTTRGLRDDLIGLLYAHIWRKEYDVAE